MCCTDQSFSFHERHLSHMLFVQPVRVGSSSVLDQSRIELRLNLLWQSPVRSEWHSSGLEQLCAWSSEHRHTGCEVRGRWQVLWMRHGGEVRESARWVQRQLRSIRRHRDGRGGRLRRSQAARIAHTAGIATEADTRRCRRASQQRRCAVRRGGRGCTGCWCHAHQTARGGRRQSRRQACMTGAQHRGERSAQRGASAGRVVVRHLLMSRVAQPAKDYSARNRVRTDPCMRFDGSIGCYICECCTGHSRTTCIKGCPSRRAQLVSQLWRVQK